MVQQEMEGDQSYATQEVGSIFLEVPFCDVGDGVNRYEGLRDAA